MEIPQLVPFNIYVGTLVVNRIMGEPKVLACPFTVVMLNPSTKEPEIFITNADSFENAAIEMDDIQYEGMKHSRIPNNTEYTVLEMRYKGDVLVWDDRLPLVPVG